MVKKQPDLISVGKTIRLLRKQSGFSQDGFAFKAQLGRSFYGRVERGETNPSATTLIRIAKVLDCEVGDLFPSTSKLLGNTEEID